MLPLRDDVRAERPAIVNGLLIVANVAVFAYMRFGLGDVAAQQEFVDRFALVPDHLRSGLAHPEHFLDTPVQYVRDVVVPLFSSMFLHAGFAHLLGNLWFLFVFGDNVEGRLGHARYLGFYLLCGLAAAVLHVLSIPPRGVVGETFFGLPIVGRNPSLDLPMLGASGAIAGVLGAYAVLFPRARVVTMPLPPLFWFLIELPALVFLGGWFVLQFVLARTESATNGVGVAYWAHVGGFVCGAFLGLFARRRS